MLKTSMALMSIVTVISSGIALAQNPRGKAEATISGSTVTIEYGRPNLRGRDVLAEAPVGTVWRTGADKSTTFTSAADLTVGGKPIPKGSYSLFTKRTGEKDWSLIFNKQTGQWGTDHDASQDLAQVPLKWEQKASGPEQFTIELAADAVRLIWGKHVLSAPLAAK